MLLALVGKVDEYFSDPRVVSLSTHPTGDRAENRERNLEIVDFPPMRMAVVDFPLAVLCWLARKLGASGRLFARTKSLRAILEADVVADLAGISFADGRGIPTLAYNTMMTGIPVLLGTPVVKCSQAMGPFQQTPTRLAAKLILPRLTAIVARGDETRRHLDDLGLENVVDGADLAFLMEVGDDAGKRTLDVLESHGVAGEFFVVSPSSVVRALCESKGIDYVSTLVPLIDGLASRVGLRPVVVAHSAIPGKEESRMNDLPVCREIARRSSSETVFIDESLDPRVLREIIGRSELLLTSRFHAMISGLCENVPVVVVSWSHKYLEVMGEFGLERFVVPFEDFDAEHLLDAAVCAVDERESISGQIESQLPHVQTSSAVSFEQLAQVANG